MSLSEDMQNATGMLDVEHTSRSSTSSPKTTIDSQITQSSVPTRQLTPPSSVGSEEELGSKEHGSEEIVGKKRTANGEIKHSRNSSLAELSQSLRTKLSYAMVKVQNGWQDNTLDEVESLASSPKSAMSAFDRSLVSPRVALAAMRQSHRLQALTEPRLAPSATIVRRRNLQISTMRPPSRPQRTLSQSAEADAVETLLFMSASPNSGRFPTFSPTSQTFSTQTSPLRSQFSPVRSRPYEDKAVLIDRLLDGLDDDMNDELDEAVRILEQHRARKMTI